MDAAVTAPMTDAEVERALPGYAGRPLAFMFRYVRAHALGHVAILLSVVVAVGAAVGSQYAIKNLVDMLAAGTKSPIWTAFAILAALIATDNMAWRVGGWIAARMFVAVTGDVRRDLFQHLTGHAPSYFSDRQPGTLASRITATANAIFLVETTVAWNVLPPCLAVAFSVGVLALISPIMAGALVVLASILSFVLVKLADRGSHLHRTYATDAAAVDGELVDVISNMPLVRAFGATFRERERFAGRVDRELTSRRQSLRYLEKLRVFHAVATAMLTAGLLAWAIMLWQQGVATTGDVVLVSTMGFTILHGTRDLAVALVNTVQQVARLSEALSTLLVPHTLNDREGAESLPQAQGRVTFERVNFAYPDGSPVLRKFSLSIQPGERVGLVGRSGSGKSTVLALLQRLRDVEEGRILIDGRDIAQLTQESLHAQLSIVPQDVSLFARSIRENIRYGRPDAADEEVLTAASDAGCDFIAELPEGFDTMVGDRGVKLSGGQRQRLAIARAFLRNAPILIMDEATSALDSESEQAVQVALDRLMVGRTVIAVAHRLSTLRDFDRIVVMQNGRILQDAAPALLERQKGPYRDLLKRQSFSVAA